MSSDRRKAAARPSFCMWGLSRRRLPGRLSLVRGLGGWEESQPLFYCVRQYDDFESGQKSLAVCRSIAWLLRDGVVRDQLIPCRLVTDVDQMVGAFAGDTRVLAGATCKLNRAIDHWRL